MGFAGKKESKTFSCVDKIVNGLFPNQEWLSEKSYTSKEKGYGGAIDLHSKTGIVIDFKTKDNLKGVEEKSLVFDNHGMQLSAYAQLLNVKDATRVSIFIDRKNPEVIVSYVWDLESNQRHLQMFNALLTYWKCLKKHDPTKTLKEVK